MEGHNLLLALANELRSDGLPVTSRRPSRRGRRRIKQLTERVPQLPRRHAKVAR